MPVPVLATKLYIPNPPPRVVLRPRLVERLDESLCQEPGIGQKLTLISAPAGFGKTTLVSEWIPGCRRPAAWLSLDEGDSDLARFLTYVVAALRSIAAGIGEEMLAALDTSPPPPTGALLTTLLNELAAIPHDFIFVLDDFHLVDSRAVDEALTFLIEHLPPQMHLAITTREDPALPLPRWRARGQLVELRAADLRFTPGEAADFLNRVMGLALSEADVAALDTRTEGWIAGLQLAALSMKGHQDAPAFIRAFAGDHRYIVDYLVEEVLKRQPEPVRAFLLQTAILERLSGPLCDAVTGQPGGKLRLEALQRGNYFVVPLDDQGRWYRYHHLFGEVLRVYLLAEQPEQAAELHRRASAWYEQDGSPVEAVRHALAAEDFPRAADLVERSFPAMARDRQEAVLLAWLQALPEALIRQRPVLCNLYAGVLLQTGAFDAAEGWLREAEGWLNRLAGAGGPPVGMAVANEEEFRRLPAGVAVHRAGHALVHGDVESTIQHARRALKLAGEDDPLRRGGAATLIGLASWTRGDLQTARQMYAEGMADLRRAGNLSDLLGCALALADIQITQGQPRAAMHTYRQALQMAADHGTPAMRGTADMLVGMSELYREQNDQQAAVQCLRQSEAQGEHTGLPQNSYRRRAALAGIRQAEGDLDGALALLDEAERLYAGDFSPNVRPIAAQRARLWIAQGRLGEARYWAHRQGLSAADDLSYLHEFEHITLARLLLANHRRGQDHSALSAAMSLLEHLYAAAEAGGRGRSAIEILILQALAQQMQGDLAAALARLERALAAAEPAGCMRLFLDEGPPMARLLQAAAARGILPEYTNKLLAGFEDRQQTAAGNIPLPASDAPILPSATSPASQPLVEPISPREQEVLRLFQTELSGPEIARELTIALSTLRTHTKSIYGKLNVDNRRAAVRRAIELGLI